MVWWNHEAYPLLNWCLSLAYLSWNEDQSPGQKPVLIRWVLLVDPDGKCRPEAFFSTDTQLTPIQMVEYFVLRWGVEVTFQESRRHLGVETQRQWTDKAIARSTPALMGLFSIVCLMALKLISTGKELMPQTTAWYQKQDVTFSDVLTFVRRYIWADKYVKSTYNTGYVLFPAQKWEAILDLLATAAQNAKVEHQIRQQFWSMMQVFFRKSIPFRKKLIDIVTDISYTALSSPHPDV